MTKDFNINVSIDLIDAEQNTQSISAKLKTTEFNALELNDVFDDFEDNDPMHTNTPLGDEREEIDPDERNELRRMFIEQLKNPVRVQQMMRDERPVYPRRLQRGRKL